MDLAHPSTLLIPAGIAALVGWRLYARFRRMVGRQRLSRVRPWLTVCLFPLLVVVLLLGSIAQPVAAVALLAGLAAGAALGVYGLRLTQFERTPIGLFYTPNAHLGIALSLLLVLRLGYRGATLYFAAGTADPATMATLGSPLTLLIFGTLAGYYVTYAAGLLRWQARGRALSEHA